MSSFEKFSFNSLFSISNVSDHKNNSVIVVLWYLCYFSFYKELFIFH